MKHTCSCCIRRVCFLSICQLGRLLAQHLESVESAGTALVFRLQPGRTTLAGTLLMLGTRVSHMLAGCDEEGSLYSNRMPAFSRA